MNASNFDLYFTIGVMLWAIFYGYYVAYRRKNRKVTIPGTSVLLSYYTEGTELLPIKTGMLGDMHYVAIATMPRSKDPVQPALIFQVTLPFSSSLHLIGIPKHNGNTQLNPGGGKGIMEEVVLEGDYPNYFTLFAEKNMQTDSRYAMDPKAMVFTVDFCQSHNWEIVDNQLYFVQTTHNAENDPTLMFDDINEFVSQIRPALAQPPTAEQIRLMTPVGKEIRNDIACPVCQKILNNKSDYLVCQNGDGVLLKGSALLKLHAGELQIPRNVLTNHNPRMHDLKCPACANPMQQVPYNGSKIIIDACNVCGYRWLDAAEVTAATIVT